MDFFYLFLWLQFTFFFLVLFSFLQVRMAYTTMTSQQQIGIEGPWNVIEVYEIPLRDRSNGTFSYAAKSHPELAGDGGGGTKFSSNRAKSTSSNNNTGSSTGTSSMIFSYNTNAGPGLQALVNRLWAYHPTFVQVDIDEDVR